MPTLLPRRVAVDQVSYLLRLPKEIWEEILVRVSQKTRPVQSHAPYPLAGLEEVTHADAATRSLVLVCRLFHDILAPLLADHMKISNLSCIQIPGRFQRTTHAAAISPYTPSIISINLTHRVASETIPLLEHPDLRGVLCLRIERPQWWIEDSFPNYFRELATCIGPQVDTVHILQSKDWWTPHDLVALQHVFPYLRRLHIADVHCLYDFDTDDESDSDVEQTSHNDFKWDQSTHNRDANISPDHGASDTHHDNETSNPPVNVQSDLPQAPGAIKEHSEVADTTHPIETPGDVSYEEEDAPILDFPLLEWLALGEVDFTPRVLHPKEPHGFEVLLRDLTPVSCPSLKRLDVLQYVGPLEDVLAQYDSILQCLCLSTSVMEHYASALTATPSLTTLRVVVDSLPRILPKTHQSLASVSVYLPAAIWPFTGLDPRSEINLVISRLLGAFVGSGFPSLKRISLYTETPVPVRYLQMFKTEFSQMGTDFVYVEVL